MSRLINPWIQFLDEDGNPYAAGTVYFGLPNQDPVANPKAPYSDAALTVAIGESQVLDDKGMFSTAVYLRQGYSMSLFDVLGNPIRTEPEIYGSVQDEFSITKATIAEAKADDDFVVGSYVRVSEDDLGNPIDSLFEVVASGTATADNIFYYDSTTPGLFQLLLKTTGAPRGNPDAVSNTVAGALRVTAGVAELIDDASHRPVGLDTPLQTTDYNIRVPYDTAIEKVSAVAVVSDDNLAPYSIMTGGSVGTNRVDFTVYAPLNGINIGTTWTAPVLTPAADLTSVVTSEVTKIDHGTGGAAAVLRDAPVVCPAVTDKTIMPIGVEFDDDSVSVTQFSDLNALVQSSGASGWTSGTTNNRQDDAITFGFAAGVLTVTHQEDFNKGHGINLTQWLVGSYRPVLVATSNTTFGVAFLDSTDTQIMTQDGDMNFRFQRDIMVKANVVATDGFTMRRGVIPVKSQRLSDVAGNNLWVIGQNEEKVKV